MSAFLHTIKSASQRTGLSEHVIRIWEKRYGAVRPTRSETRRRLYSEEEVARLKLLGEATAAGYAIRTIALLPTDSLKQLVNQQDRAVVTSQVPTIEQDAIAKSVTAVKAMDGERLEQILGEALVGLGTHGLLQRVIGPLAEEVGELWRAGTITAAHEHFLSAAIRTYVGKNVRAYSISSAAPVLVVATPANQLHELGAMIVSAAASDVGWRVIYLGASLPAAEIAGAAVQNKARAVALSIVYPADDPQLAGELLALREFLPTDVAILAGGRSAGGYAETLEVIGALEPADLGGLYDALDDLREKK